MKLQKFMVQVLSFIIVQFFFTQEAFCNIEITDDFESLICDTNEVLISESGNIAEVTIITCRMTVSNL